MVGGTKLTSGSLRCIVPMVLSSSTEFGAHVEKSTCHHLAPIACRDALKLVLNQSTTHHHLIHSTTDIMPCES